MESYGGMILTGENRSTRRETCPSATMSSTNPTYTEPGANSGLRGERPATNRLSYDTAMIPLKDRRFCFFGNNIFVLDVSHCFGG
jgi:hypothetical protein